MSPFIDLNKCIKCDLCSTICTAQAIDDIDKKINQDRCIGCGQCMTICPVQAVTVDGKLGSPLTDSLIDSVSLDSLIRKRRSCRHYDSTPIERSVIDSLTETLIHSPTGTNGQGVKVTIVDDGEKIQELTTILMKRFDFVTKILLTPLTYPLIRLITGKKLCSDLFGYKKMICRYWQGEDRLSHDAPLLILFSHKRFGVSPSQDTTIWATTALFQAETLGIGTCFNGLIPLGININRRARKFLHIGGGEKVYLSFTAGYPLYKHKREAIREKNMVHYI